MTIWFATKALLALSAGIIITYSIVSLFTGFTYKAVLNVHGQGVSLDPAQPSAEYKGSYYHLDTEAIADRVEKGDELPDGEYEEGSVALPRAVI